MKLQQSLAVRFAVFAALWGTFLFASNVSAHIRITPVGRMGTSDAVKFIQNNRNRKACMSPKTHVGFYVFKILFAIAVIWRRMQSSIVFFT